MEPWIWAILLLMLGTGLALLEVFFPLRRHPGLPFGPVALLGAVVMGFYQNATVGVLILVGVAFGLPTVIVVAFQYWPKTAMGQRVLLPLPQGVKTFCLTIRKRNCSRTSSAGGARRKANCC